MKQKSFLWAIGTLVLIAVLVYAYTEYNRKPSDLFSVVPQARVTASELVGKYSNDEQKANGLYLGKNIEVTGMISEINNQHDTLMNVMLGDHEDLHRVSCLLDRKYIMLVKQKKPGDKITLKGICTGYLMDVELNRCVLAR